MFPIQGKEESIVRSKATTKQVKTTRRNIKVKEDK
jgi:hypothetical protein|tara:strand:+ start:546 stop:650 length:105 start_codon:yes stop_codon:yes gene_type:complete